MQNALLTFTIVVHKNIVVHMRLQTTDICLLHQQTHFIDLHSTSWFIP